MNQRRSDPVPVGWLRVAVGVPLLVAVVSLYRVWHDVTWLKVEEIGRHERESVTETGIELLGTGRSVALVVSGCVATVLLLATRARLALLLAALAGVAFACSSLRVLFEWRGSDLRLMAAVPLASGAAAAVLVVWDECWRRRVTPTRRVHQLIEVVVVAAVVVAASGWPLRHTTPASGFADLGPFEQIAAEAHHYGFDYSTDVVISDGRPAVLESDGLWTVDRGGRSFPRFEADDVESGIIDGRIVMFDPPDVAIVDVERADLWVTIPQAVAESVSTDGTLWLSDRTGDNPDTVYRVAIARLPASGVVALDQLDAFELDRGNLGSPLVSTRDTLYWVGGLAGRGEAVYRWRAGEDVRPQRIAGGHDPACGQLADALDAYLGDVTAITHDGRRRGWLWLAGGSHETGETRLYRLGPLDDDEAVLLRADVEIPLSIESMVVDERGDLIVLSDDDDDGATLWRLPDPEQRLEELAGDEPDCAPSEPPTVGEPPERLPITDVVVDRSARVVPLSTDGHYALVLDDERIHLVGPSGTTQGVLAFDDRAIWEATPDGDGGLWVEVFEDPDSFLGVDPEDSEVELVHVDAAGSIDREIPVRGVGWVSELASGTGRTPALLTESGLVTLGDDGELTALLDESWNISTVDSMVGDRDGGLWLVRDGVLYSVVDGEAIPLAGVDEDVNTGAAWSVQLARGVPAGELRFGDALLALAADGRLVLVGREDGVVLAVDPETGDVEVVGQDPEVGLTHGSRLFSVDGGVVTVEDEPAGDERGWVIEEVLF